MATLMLRIHDDLEAGDAEKLETLLRDSPGVFGVVVSSAEGCAEVDIEDDEVDIDDLVARVRQAGFDARMSG